MEKFLLVIIMVFCLGSFTTAQTKTYDIEELDSLMLVEKKPVFILLSSKWCKYCDIQKNQLLKNKKKLEQAEGFYWIIFNAEKTEQIVFHRSVFRYNASGLSSGVHELAIALNGSENVIFPTWIVLNDNYEVLFRYCGILRPSEIQRLITLTKKK